jgi:hypothetical protein
MDPDAVPGRLVDQLVEAREVVVDRGRLVAGVELRLRHRVRPEQVHPLPSDAESPGQAERLVALDVPVLLLDEDGVVLEREFHASRRPAVTCVDEAAGEDGGGRDQRCQQCSGVAGYGKHGANLL